MNIDDSYIWRRLKAVEFPRWGVRSWFLEDTPVPLIREIGESRVDEHMDISILARVCLIQPSENGFVSIDVTKPVPRKATRIAFDIVDSGRYLLVLMLARF